MECIFTHDDDDDDYDYDYVCIRSYPESALRYKCLILDTYHLDTLYVREQVCENSWLFLEAKRGSAS